MFFNFRLLLSKVHISLDALTIWRNVRKIQKAPFVSLVLGGIDSDPLGYRKPYLSFSILSVLIRGY